MPTLGVSTHNSIVPFSTELAPSQTAASRTVSFILKTAYWNAEMPFMPSKISPVRGAGFALGELDFASRNGRFQVHRGSRTWKWTASRIRPSSG